jgi:hypothetical protein
MAKSASIMGLSVPLIVDGTTTFPVPGWPGSGEWCGEPRFFRRIERGRFSFDATAIVVTAVISTVVKHRVSTVR